VSVVRLTVPGDPVAKGRPRLGRNGNVYTPAQTRDAEHAIGWRFKQAYPGWEPFDAPVFVDLVFRCAPVERHPDGRFKRQPIDCDNAAKLVLDALNAICWTDDALVVRLTVAMIRDSDDPGTDVTIGRIG
jgi:crossover junction endodeoxyribonuclease RusA